MYIQSRFDPLGWDQLFRGFDRFFQEFDRDYWNEASAKSALTEEDDHFALRVEVPGLSDKDVHVDFDAGVLTISAERKASVPEGYEARRRERPDLHVSRSFALGDAVDPEKITAEIKDGVLTVRIGKTAAQKKRSIQVTAH
jgi:HSP20 family protein